MATYAIQTQDLDRRFGEVHAVRKLNLAVPARSVYAFLGPNGAGKTTTIRLICGLLHRDSGVVKLFGDDFHPGRRDLLRRLSALIESPSLYPHLTGRENLELKRRVFGLPDAEVGRVLTMVRLEKDAHRLARTYSTGMRQRLGLALAMLASPELLILDEPSNGLDPAGMSEVRALIRELSRRHGVTVFLSSHLLAEVEEVADHVGIISHGRLVFQGELSGLRAQQSAGLVVGVNSPEPALLRLAEAGYRATRSSANRIMVANAHNGDAAAINRMLVQSGIAVDYLAEEAARLERIFLELTESQSCAASQFA